MRPTPLIGIEYERQCLFHFIAGTTYAAGFSVRQPIGKEDELMRIAYSTIAKSSFQKGCYALPDGGV
jgi:hypothetical protein